jgi:hypothetical protein
MQQYGSTGCHGKQVTPADSTYPIIFWTIYMIN